jgi:hypothetical protein
LLREVEHSVRVQRELYTNAIYWIERPIYDRDPSILPIAFHPEGNHRRLTALFAILLLSRLPQLIIRNFGSVVSAPSGEKKT